MSSFSEQKASYVYEVFVTVIIHKLLMISIWFCTDQLLTLFIVNPPRRSRRGLYGAWLYRFLIFAPLLTYSNARLLSVRPSVRHSVCNTFVSLHINWTLWTIFIKLHSNVPLSETGAEHMTQLPRIKVTGRGIYPLISCLLHIARNLRAIFIICYPNVPLSKTVCEHITQLPRLKFNTTGQGQVIYPWISCPPHIPWTLAISIKLYQNVPLSEKMCRTYDSATQTQGHTSR